MGPALEEIRADGKETNADLQQRRRKDNTATHTRTLLESNRSTVDALRRQVHAVLLPAHEPGSMRDHVSRQLLCRIIRVVSLKISGKEPNRFKGSAKYHFDVSLVIIKVATQYFASFVLYGTTLHCFTDIKAAADQVTVTVL